MDIKAGIIGILVVACGFLFYLSQKREDTIADLTSKYQAALAHSPAGPVGTDAALVESIRAQVKTELAARPAQADCSGKGSTSDLTRLQDLQVKMDDLDKKFLVTLNKLTDPQFTKAEEDRVVAKANRIKEKVLALCKK